MQECSWLTAPLKAFDCHFHGLQLARPNLVDESSEGKQDGDSFEAYIKEKIRTSHEAVSQL